jgi:hypothetical protein
MSAPFRITYQSLKKVADEPQAGFQDYLGRLIKLIPAEVISLYLVGKGIIEKDQSWLLGWTIFCFLAVLVVRLYGTAEPKENKPPQLLAVAIACVSYLVWVYSMGDVFALLNLHSPKAGSLMVLGWSFVVPYFYKGDRTS